MEDLGAASLTIPAGRLAAVIFLETTTTRTGGDRRIPDNDGMEGLMRISLAVVAVVLVASAAQAQGTAKKQASWSRSAPVQQVQSISNSSLRYYGGPKGERGLAMPSGR